MKTPRILAALATVTSLAALGAGCGGDPIVGRWRATRSDSTGLTETIFEFQGNGFVNITISKTYNTDATMLPGCVETVATTAGGYRTSGVSGTGGTVMLNGTGVCTLTRASCRTATDNLASTSCAAGMTGFGAVGGSYSVSGNTLTVTLGSEEFVCMRQ